MCQPCFFTTITMFKGHVSIMLQPYVYVVFPCLNHISTRVSHGQTKVFRMFSREKSPKNQHSTMAMASTTCTQVSKSCGLTSTRPPFSNLPTDLMGRKTGNGNMISWEYYEILLGRYPSWMVFMENPSISWMMTIWVWINTY